jgi:hypothetical protein
LRVLDAMADERNKVSWWQSAPGLMTATAGVIAAITGLLGGLNQIGMLDRWKQPPAVETASRPSLRDSVSNTKQHTGTQQAPQVAVPTPSANTPKSRGAATGLSPSRPKRSAAPSTATADTGVRDTAKADTTRAAPARADTTRSGAARPDSAVNQAAPPPPIDTARDSGPPAKTAGGQIPTGTVLELAAANRICSTTSQTGDRVPATVVVPVTGTGGAAVPVGATAILQVTRLDAPVFLGVQADSLSVNGRGYALRNSTARVHQREFTAGAGQTGVGIGACIPAGGRITVTLRAPVNLGPS